MRVPVTPPPTDAEFAEMMREDATVLRELMETKEGRKTARVYFALTQASMFMDQLAEICEFCPGDIDILLNKAAARQGFLPSEYDVDISPR